jgi:hypothetical protein
LHEEVAMGLKVAWGEVKEWPALAWPLLKGLGIGSWRFVGQNHEQIKIIFAIIVAGWTLHEYRSSVEEGRVAEAIKRVERYQAEPILGSRRAYLDYWLTGKGAELLANNPRTKWNELIDKQTAAQGLERHVLTLTLFFNEIAACADRALCDVVTSCNYFRRDIDALRNSHTLLLKRWEEAYRESFRTGLDMFVTKTCKDV